MDKRKTTGRDAKQDKRQKKSKDPGMPKRPPSAFFVFMEDFRKSYKEKHPEVKSVATVGKAGGNKWSSLTDEEKAPYVSIAADRKVEYEKKMDAYNRNKDAAEKSEQGDSNEDGSDED
eukprot:c2969_g1_i1 orf=182-535(+)